MKEFTLKNGKMINLVDKDDTVIEELEGKVKIGMDTKKGRTDHTYYTNYLALEKEQGKNKILDRYNRFDRTLRINEKNLGTRPGSELKKDIKETKEVLSKDQQAALDAKLIAMVKEIKENAIAAAKGHK